jgi:hypothetical protein
MSTDILPQAARISAVARVILSKADARQRNSAHPRMQCAEFLIQTVG